MMTLPVRRSARGFTLAEVVIAVPLIALILFGVMELYLSAAKSVVKTQGETSTSQDAANSLQFVIDRMRESQQLWLPGEGDGSNNPGSSFIYNNIHQSGITAASYSAYISQLPSGAYAYTAMEVLLPPALNPSDVGYAGSVSPVPANITVNGSSGTIPLTGSNAPWTRNSLGTVDLLIYRSDVNGVPAPSNGQYLWALSVQDNGAQYNGEICNTIASAADAVQFERPSGTGNNNIGYVKIVSGAYSPIQGYVTNEQTNGQQTTALIGKCILMRDNEVTNQPSSLQGAQHRPTFPVM